MKISVVTAVYNRQSTVAEAIASVQAQTWPDVEHVIQDGGSSDGTLDIIRGMANASTRLESAPDAGIYDAINKGIARATGEVIGLMHSDDAFAGPHVLEKVARMFEDPAIDGVYGDLEYVSASPPHRVLRYWKSGPYHPGLLKRGWMPPHPTLYLRRAVFDTWGLYDTRYRIAADYDAILRYLGKGGVRLGYIPEVMVRMKAGGVSNRSLKTIARKSREDLAAMRRNGVGGIGTLALKNLSKIRQVF